MITKVIQSLPGISPSIGGFRNDIIIRGGGPNETVYYIDGIEIPNINHFSTQGSSGGPVGLVNVSFIKDVTLSTSAFGAEYDNALSGVLSFDQKDANIDGISGNFRLGSSEAGITFEGPVSIINNKETSFIFSVRRSYLQFLFKAFGFSFLPDYWDYQMKIRHKIDDYKGKLDYADDHDYNGTYMYKTKVGCIERGFASDDGPRGCCSGARMCPDDPCPSCQTWFQGGCCA